MVWSSRIFLLCFLVSFSEKYLVARRASGASPSTLFRLRMQPNSLMSGRTSSVTPSTDEALKLPIIQVYVGDEMKGELFCGQDVTSSMMKFSFLMNRVFESLDSIDSISTTSVAESTISQPEPTSRPLNPINVYSDSQLNKILPFTYIFETPTTTPVSEGVSLHSSDVNVVFVNRLGCKQCAAAEPVYAALINPYLTDARFTFYQVDVENVPEYMAQLRTRLSGTRGTFPESCADCKNTGFEPCAECNGAGLVARGTMTVYCPVCTGYKKIRCRVCGGKCLQCN